MLAILYCFLILLTCVSSGAPAAEQAVSHLSFGCLKPSCGLQPIEGLVLGFMEYLQSAFEAAKSGLNLRRRSRLIWLSRGYVQVPRRRSEMGHYCQIQPLIVASLFFGNL